MRILILPDELGSEFNERDTGAVVQELRRRGFNNVYMGTAVPSKGDMTLTDVLRLADMVAAARHQAAGLGGAAAPGDDPAEWPGLRVLVAARAGHEPLRVDAATWAGWDVLERTAAIYRYVAACVEKENEAARAARRRLTVTGDERLQTAVRLVMGALPSYDQLFLDNERVEVVARSGLWEREGKRGLTWPKVDEAGRVMEYVIEIDTAVETDKELLRVVAHEFLHVTQRHSKLLALTHELGPEGKELRRALQVVFELQVKQLVGEVYFYAAPDFRLY